MDLVPALHARVTDLTVQAREGSGGTSRGLVQEHREEVTVQGDKGAVVVDDAQLDQVGAVLCVCVRVSVSCDDVTWRLYVPRSDKHVCCVFRRKILVAHLLWRQSNGSHMDRRP